MKDKYINKPKKYSRFKRLIIKRLFTLKRKVSYLFDNKKYSKSFFENKFEFKIFEHKSFLLRELKDVEMYLQINKITNLKLAIKKINGIVIKPKETFSFWKLIGRPTKKKGYLEGLLLFNGHLKKGIGGGLCQLSNLLYWMFLHTPLEVTERWKHSFDVFPDVNRKIPFGSGATVSYNYVDLQVYNPTEQNFQICLWLSDEYLNGEILSDKTINKKYQVFEQGHQIVQQWWGGYTRQNEIHRKIIDIDGTEKTEFVTQNYAIMIYNPMLNP